MIYEGRSDGRVDIDGSDTGSVGFLTFDDVQERLIEAIQLCWRLPDRERAWLTVRSYWPEMRRHNAFGDYSDDDPDARPRALPLSRAQIGRMDEALGWLDAIDPIDRKLIGLALVELAKGRQQVPWLDLRRPMGVKLGADGLRKRYERAIGAICRKLNA